MEIALKIFTVIGARPQFVKAATLSRIFRQHQGIQEVIAHTGQHFDSNMSSVFFTQLDIPEPDFHLGIGGGSHAKNTGQMLITLESLMEAERPDWVLVYGDTDSTLAGALAAAKLHIPVAHVEAGLRSFNRKMPEEINRVMTDHLSHTLFAPTVQAVAYLAREGISGEAVHCVGDVMKDAALFYGQYAPPLVSFLGDVSVVASAYVLATFHRPENVDHRDRLSEILAGLEKSPLPVIWPIHPRTRKRLIELGLPIPKSIKVIDPVGYLEMVALEKNARVIVTDSGGVQKEAYFHQVPCLTIRQETEWVELLDCGANRLLPAEADAIAASLECFPEFRTTEMLYGNGDAAARIVDVLLRNQG